MVVRVPSRERPASTAEGTGKDSSLNNVTQGFEIELGFNNLGPEDGVAWSEWMVRSARQAELRASATTLFAADNETRTTEAASPLSLLPLGTRATAGPLRVHRLELHDNALCSSGGSALAVGLGANPPLAVLTLSDCSLGNEAGVCIAQALQWNGALTQLGESLQHLTFEIFVITLNKEHGLC